MSGLRSATLGTLPLFFGSLMFISIKVIEKYSLQLYFRSGDTSGASSTRNTIRLAPVLLAFTRITLQWEVSMPTSCR